MKKWIFKSLWSALVLSATFMYGYNKAPKVQLETPCQPSSIDIGEVLAKAQNSDFDYGAFLHRNGEDLIVEKQINEICIFANKIEDFTGMSFDVNGEWDTNPGHIDVDFAIYDEGTIFSSESSLDAYVKTHWVGTNQTKV